VNRKMLFIGAAALLGVAFVAGTLVYKSERTQQSTQTPSAIRRPRPIPFADARQPGRKVHIVEFLDPACETCRSFYPHVKQIMAANPARSGCRSHVPFHNGSDYVVKVLEAAKKQGKYWQALEAVLASQANWVINHKAQPDRVWQSLEGLGLNFEQLKVDMNAPEVAQRLEQDSRREVIERDKDPGVLRQWPAPAQIRFGGVAGLVKETLQAAY